MALAFIVLPLRQHGASFVRARHFSADLGARDVRAHMADVADDKEDSRAWHTAAEFVASQQSGPPLAKQ
jgi:hypothetical protein